MAVSPRRKTKAPAAQVKVPQNREQTASFIGAIGEHQRELERIRADMNEELAVVKERWEKLATPHATEIESLTEGVQIWCEANRDALTQSGKVKTAAFATGEVSWRVNPPSVRITGAEAVLDALRRMNLRRFIREKAEVNREAILNEPGAVAQVPGISISQREDFSVIPFEAELAEAK